MNSLLSNSTCVLIDLPYSSKPIGCMWVFRKKYAMDGSILTYKVRLVAKDFRQKEVLIISTHMHQLLELHPLESFGFNFNL